MNSGRRRLQKVEDALDPTEAMALWLDHAKQEHHSLRDLVESLLPQHEEAMPLFQLTRQAEAAARARLKAQAALYPTNKGQRADFLERGERDAVRDAATLWYLFVDANVRFMAEKRALCLLFALLASSIREWIKEGKLRGEDPLDGRLRTSLAELYMWQQTMALLSERYYQGQSPFLDDAEELLSWIVEQAEHLVAMFNDRLEWEIEVRKAGGNRKPKLPSPIAIERVRRNADSAAKAQVVLMVDMARAHACDMMGEQKRALAFAERHL